MTTEEFVENRLEQLRTFFKRRFGRHWHRIVAKRLGYTHFTQWLPGYELVNFKQLCAAEKIAKEAGMTSTFERKFSKRSPRRRKMPEPVLDTVNEVSQEQTSSSPPTAE